MTSSDSALGFMVVGGVRVPIVELKFERGRLVVRGECSAPDETVSGPVTVFGVDGVGVFQGTDEITLESYRGWRPTTFSVTYELTVDHVFRGEAPRRRA